MAVVDGNVFRVLARYFGVESDIAQSKTKKEFQELANSLLPKGKAALFNQAVMEFGAMQCVPKNPDCNVCPLNESCFALQRKRVEALPVKSKKVKIKDRYFNYLIVTDVNGNFLVEKRTSKGIWHNLYQFPLVETEKEIPITEVKNKIAEKYKGATSVFFEGASVIHKLSHQHLNIRFFQVQLHTEVKNAIEPEALLKLPVPIVLHNFIIANLSTVF
nr:NUDIX domain-containing protein [Flavobacterium sediminis]